MSTAIDSVPALVSGTTIRDEIVEARGPWSAIVATTCRTRSTAW